MTCVKRHELDPEQLHMDQGRSAAVCSIQEKIRQSTRIFQHRACGALQQIMGLLLCLSSPIWINLVCTSCVEPTCLPNWCCCCPFHNFA